MKIKIMIRDGIIETVLADQEAMDSGLEVNIVDFDSEAGDKKLYESCYDDPEYPQELPHHMEHCEEPCKEPEKLDPVHFYELCFFGEHEESHPGYIPEKACSHVIKTEIPPAKINKEIATEILSHDPQEWTEELRGHCTALMYISEEEADFFFNIDSLTERIESPHGVFYTRPRQDCTDRGHGNAHEVTEVCPHCMHENTFIHDVEKNGYQAACQQCGEKIMLCSECMHADDNPGMGCDWDKEAGCFRKPARDIQEGQAHGKI